jgi:ABC-2 type transport system permease protein
VNGHRALALFRRVVQEIRRDRPSLALLFVAPVVMTGLITFIVREGETPSVDAAIVNEAGQIGAAIVAAITPGLETGGGTVVEVADVATARAMLEEGSASIAVLLPADLGSAAPVTITVVTEGLEPTADAAQVGALQRAVSGAVAGALGMHPPTIVHETLYGVPSEDPIAAYAPAIVGFFAYFFVYILTGVSFLRERTGGTLERLMATPVRRSEVVLGYTLGFGLFAAIQVAVLMAWGLGTLEIPVIGPLPAFSIGLGIPTAGSPLLAYLVVLLTAAGAVSLGILLSTFARTELQVVQFIPLVIVPQFLLSGVLFPVSTLPEILRPLAVVMPITYTVDGLRRVFVAGADLATPALQLDLVVLVGIAALFATLAALTIRRDVA